MSGRTAPDDFVLLRLLRSPAGVREFSVHEWEDVISQCRETRLGGRILRLLRDETLPATAHRRLLAAFVEGEHLRLQMLWEIDRLQRVIPDFIVLKGGAYAVAGLEMARGRPAADLDIMVPQPRIAETERLLLEHGWEHVIIDEYDQRYYRTWMHELPPLRHRERVTELDLHHAIAPRSSRLRVTMAPIFDAAVPVAGGLRTLAPIDMVLHCALHLFHDGEIAGSLRDLVDFDELLRQFGGDAFWRELVPRALRLGVDRPLFYALRYSERLLATPIPDYVLREAWDVRPAAALVAFMDFAVPNALIPLSSAQSKLAARFSAFTLYVRSHWLRMSTPLLIAHLTRKGVRHWKARPKVE